MIVLEMEKGTLQHLLRGKEEQELASKLSTNFFRDEIHEKIGTELVLKKIIESLKAKIKVCTIIIFLI